MKKLALAIVAGLALGACASMDGSNGATARAMPAAGTQYCWQDRLSTEGGKLDCNWAPDRRAACEGTVFTTMDAARYSKPRKASLCANGQWLVEVAPAG
jgi:hypothetical protein